MNHQFQSLALTSHDQNFWNQHGYIVRRSCLNQSLIGALQDAVDQMEHWANEPGKWMRYFETNGSNQQLCRVENFLPYQDVCANFLQSKEVCQLIDALMGEPSVIFKDKINYKLPGGNGFAAHQDAPAFVSFGQTFHITMLVAIDKADQQNGCLEIADTPRIMHTLAQNPDGTLCKNLADELRWIPIPTDPGDIVCFDSYVPHRSGSNKSDRSRRSLYITYNRRAEGDCRERYYSLKRQKFPPEYERSQGVDYSEGSRIFNLANPIQS